MSLINKIFKKEADDKSAAKVDKVESGKKEKSTSEKKEVKQQAPKKAEKPVSVKANKKQDLQAYKIIKAPVITEKVTDLTQFNKYTFVVPRQASKSEIKKKIINVYGVTPIKINIINVSGKKIRYGRTRGMTKAWKKAIITLAPQDKLEIYEGV